MFEKMVSFVNTPGQDCDLTPYKKAAIKRCMPNTSHRERRDLTRPISLVYMFYGFDKLFLLWVDPRAK